MNLFFRVSLISAFCVAFAAAQPVRAPRAQALIDTLLREHPEIQTIGLHVTPPGLTDNVNIACSKLGKVGKRSAAIDIEVLETGKPSSRMANKGAFDIGVPIADASGRKLGMIVVVIPAVRAKDKNDAMAQVLKIRDILQSRIPSAESLFVGATLVRAPVVMVGQTPLPDVKGDFSRLGVDVAGNKIYAIAPENHSVEVFDLAGEHLKSIPGTDVPSKVVWNNGATSKYGQGFATPGTVGDISFEPSGRRLFVTGSEGLAIYRQLDAGRYEELCRFNTMGGVRSIYVPEKKTLYIIHGKNAEDGAGLQVYEVKD